MTTLYLDGLAVHLKEFHDLSWVSRFGRVFRVFDQLMDGCLGLGVEGSSGRFYLRYAGAAMPQYPHAAQAPIDRLAAAAPRYQWFSHISLARLLHHEALPQGYLLAFQWLDGLQLAPVADNYRLLRSEGLISRLNMMDAMLDLHTMLEERGLAVSGLQESHLLYLPHTSKLVLTSLDDYLPMPALNLRGRTQGSPFYLAPECYQKNAAVDETSSVYALGAIAHLLFGDRTKPNPAAWDAGPALYQVAEKALHADRTRRYQSMEALRDGWREAVLKSRF